jgi:Trypsin-like peptidase domain/Effector-associated domain 1
MLILQGQQFEQLRDALLAAFSPATFDEMLLFQLGRRRTDIALGESQQEIVLRVIQRADSDNWVSDLLRAARESNPGSPELLAFAQQFGLAIDTQWNVRDDARLERTIVETNSMLDPAIWRTKLSSIEHQICRIEIPARDPTFGTGFLLGPDLVMTNYHVIEKVYTGEVAPGDVTLRFDYALMADGITPNPGTVHQLAGPAWLVDHSEYSPIDTQADPRGAVPDSDQLDYALLRVAGSPGDEPVGGSDNENPNAPPRGWIGLPAETHAFVPGTAVFIMQHPKGEKLKLALETRAVIGVNANRTRVRYKTNTEHGSSGSPCFDANWNLIALHHVGDPDYDRFHKPEYNQGIPITTIVDLLEQRGKEGELGVALQPAPSVFQEATQAGNLNRAQAPDTNPPTTDGKEVSPYEVRFLRKNWALVDRHRLREALRDLYEDNSRILVVDGQGASGKSYSMYLISFLKKKMAIGKTARIDLFDLAQRAGEREVSPVDIGVSITAQWGLEGMPRLHNEQEARWTRHFCDWLTGKLANADALHWIVVDHFNKVPPNQGVDDLILEMASRIYSDLDMMRLVLLSYRKMNDLGSLVEGGNVELEDILPIGEDDLTEFFALEYEHRKQQHNVPYSAVDIVMSVAQVMRQVDPNSPRRLQRLREAVAAEASQMQGGDC